MKVKLEEVIEALDSAGPEMEFYYSTKTEKIFMVFDGMVNGDDNKELIEEIEDGWIEDYIPLPDQYQIHEYSMMEDFVYEHTTGKAQEQLEHAMQGRGAFRRFKDKLYDLDLEKQWYKFRDEAYEKVAREWCEKYKIDIVE